MWARAAPSQANLINMNQCSPQREKARSTKQHRSTKHKNKSQHRGSAETKREAPQVMRHREFTSVS
jgi:hypothetical protein